ncbi:hypothetical protein [Rhodopirellula sp. MGV]|uniref:hypothetical protein n=1 Tax=Rhodopirellula sp. MGV TaxID=2023130 RepID=UPI000B95E733|nr:hypothetical protein [Rhodopirellula sp. MGV]OYP35765.1 hypothetical protein CGZ80_10835 [Rhodopirellula sp. MGV]PNY33652.1 hypothetical protein C2E31_26455 [Rhodopirellula baltica]
MMRQETTSTGLSICIALIATQFVASLFAATLHAQGPAEMTFHFQDTSVINGTLGEANRDDAIGFQSDLLSGPAQSSIENLLEAGLVTPSTASNEFDQDSFAARLVDDSQLVGRINQWNADAIQIDSPALGAITIGREQLVSLRRLVDVPQRVASLSSLPYRFELQPGWRFDSGHLIGDQPGSMVSRLQLPERFRLLVDIECLGEANLQLALGDRADSGAGQGSRFRLGGSVSRSPEEQLVTHAEWFGSSVSLVRGNASIADVAVFPLTNPNRLWLEFRVDQREGRFVALSGGIEVGRAELHEAVPAIRQSLTLTNRGDAIRVKRMEVMRWDGQSDEPAELPNAQTKLRDDTTIDHAIASGEVDLADIRSIGFGRAVDPANACEITLLDQTRLRGQLQKSEDGKVVIVNRFGQSFQIDPSQIRRIIGVAKHLKPSPGVQLRNGEQRLVGQLVAPKTTPGLIDLRCPMLDDVVGVLANPESRIEFAMDPQGSDSNASFQPTLVLQSGDRMRGSFESFNDQSLSFAGQFSMPCQIPDDAMGQFLLQPMAPPGAQALRYALSVPRIQKGNPPSHLLISPQGDLLRGRLLRLDQDAATMEIRQVERRIPRTSIGSIVRLKSLSGPTFQGQSINVEAVIITQANERLSLANVRYDQNQFEGDHPQFGHCQIPMSAIRMAWLGDRPDQPNETWQLRPTKDPRSYEDPLANESSAEESPVDDSKASADQ